MKKFILFSLVISATFLISCDKIEQPFPVVDTIDTTNLNVDFNDTVVVSNNNLRRILLEDYTGQECGNCPQAAEVAEDLLVQYPQHLSVLAVHAGFFAEPDQSDPKYNLDLTTEAGDIYDSEFGNSAKGNPNGLINRIDDENGDPVFKPAEWASLVDSFSTANFNTNPEVNIELTSIYNTEEKALRLFSSIILNKSLSGDYNIVAFIHEKGIFGYHKKYEGGQTLTLENYEFKHVLRKALPTPWGKQLIVGGAGQNDSFDDEISYNIPDTFNPENIGVIVCFFEANTKEILQTVEVKSIVSE